MTYVYADRCISATATIDKDSLCKKKVDTDLSGQMCLQMRKPHLVNARRVRLSEAIAKVSTIFAKLSGRHVDT